jgi:bacteriorhodopsin
MKLTLALFALAAAQAQDSGAGYEAEGQEYGYEATPAAFTGYVPKTQLCLGACPKHSKCQNKATGACTGGITAPHYATAAYTQEPAAYTQEPAAYTQTAAEEQTGYRKLAGQYAQESFGEGEEFGAYSEGEPAFNDGCPRGYLNLDCASLKNRTVLWVGFGLLFIPSLYFFWIGFSDANYANIDTPTHFFSSGTNFVQDAMLSRFICGVICFIASLAYLTMALGYGYTTRCCDGRQFFYARYVDWAVTTPLLLFKILKYANIETHEEWFIYAMDILMIVAGLIGALICGNNDKWAFFGFSMLCFLPIIYFICQFSDRLNDDAFKGVYGQVVALTAFTWIFYPIIWILAEGTGTICAQAEAVCYTVLDIIAKSVFGFILCQPRALWINEGLQPIGSML